MSTIITHKQFPNERTYEMDLCGRPLSIQVGKVAELASASAMVRYGETTVMVAVTVSPRPRDGVDFFPLSVDFEEKLYAVGRIPGSFLRREGQPSLPAVLASRVIDRSIRPLFPYDFRNDVVVTCTVMSLDRDCSPEVTAMIGTSACLAISNIPWAGPIGCVEAGYVDGQIVLNPTNEQKHASQLDLTVAATAGKVIMIEAGAKELPDDIMYDAIVKSHEEIQKQVELINRMVSEIGKEKMTYDHADFDQELFDKIVEATMDEAKAAMDTETAGTSSSWTTTPRWTNTWRRSPTSSRRRSSRRGSSRATGWTAAPRTRSGLWPPRWACCPRSTAPASSPAARPRCSRCAP